MVSRAQKILILGHHNADPDAICSMIAFHSFCERINPSGKRVLACDDVSRLSTQVVSVCAPNVEILEEDEDSYDLVVILDTNSSLQLGDAFAKYVADPSKVLVIDHHEENPDIHEIAEHTLVDVEASSTCEVLVTLFDEIGFDIDVNIANLLLTGMLFDTRRFYYVGPATLQSALKLVQSGANYDECIYALVIRPDRSERIARLKAASRLKIHPIEDWVVVTAKIGAYEASSCRGLIDLGADVAIVGGKPKKDLVRISARSTHEFYKQTGINLGTDVMEPIGEVIGGKGGGHPNAAGANGVRNRKKALEESVELIRRLLVQKSQNKDIEG